jgi:hypothetical protein
MRVAALLLVFAACTGEMVGPDDSGLTQGHDDAGLTDAGGPDAGSTDAGAVDAGTMDVDAGHDAGPVDGGRDAGPASVRLRDAGLLVPDGGTGEEPTSARPPFSFRMAGAMIVANDPLTATPQQLLADHFSYVGQYALNNCANNTAPYSCAANGCNYPGNPASTEIPTYAQLASWLSMYQAAGLYVGIWGVTTTNVEAEGHCFAEIVNTLRSAHGITVSFIDVDGEKAYETVQTSSQRFVTEFNATLAVPNVAKAYTPECHTAVPMAPWLTGGFTSIMPMAYWNDVNTNPSYCLNWAYAYGVPKAQAQVMLDGYKHGTPHTWSEYADDMVTVMAQGFSVWRTLGSTEWDQFKPLIETKGIAQYGAGVGNGPMQATASSGTTAAKLVDSDLTTRAQTLSQPGAWLAFDLGTPRLTDLARLWSSRVQSYTVDVDPNDCAFDDASRVADVSSAAAGMPSTYAYAPRLTRCVRLQVKGTDLLDPFELEVHRNLAREATVTASSNHDPVLFPNSNLVDGKRADIAHTQQQLGAWFALDFGRPRTIDRVNLWNRHDCCQDRLKNYVLEADPNDCAFDDPVRIADVTNVPAGAPSSWAFDPITARCVRLRVKDDMPLHPSELQVFGY